MTHKSFVFTINNYTDDDIQDVHRIKDITNTLYAAFEKGEVNGTPHIQGFVTFKKTKRLGAVSRLLPRAHLQPAKGGKSNNYNYIIRGENTDGTAKLHSEVFVNHDVGTPGTRTDIKNLLEFARQHGVKRTAEEHPVEYFRYSKGIRAWLTAVQSPRTEAPNVYWLFGSTGIGKTKFTFDQARDPDLVFNARLAPKWWDGLDSHHTWALIDEFDKRKEFDHHELLTILDRYNCVVEVKGGSVNFKVPNIVITSSVHPQNLFPADIFAQVYRRLTNIGTKASFNDPWEWEMWGPGRIPEEYNNADENSVEDSP